MKRSVSADTTWYYSPEPWRFGSATIEDLLGKALDYLATIGVRVPPSGRHALALKLLRKANRSSGGMKSLDANERLRLEHAHRTAYEIVLIAVASYRLRRHRSTSPFLVEKLQQVMGGAETYGPGRSQARDVQFEMFVAAQLVLGGLEVAKGEPDIRFKYGYELVGVAVKRLDSLALGQVRHNITDAADQIAGTGLRGWIALNLDTRFEGLPLVANRPTLLKRFSRAFDSIIPVAARFGSGPHVLGIITYAHLSGWRPANSRRKVPELLIRAPFRWLGWESDQAAPKLFFADFSEAWRGRIENAIQAIMRGQISLVA